MLSHVVNIILVFFTLGLILLFVVAHFTRFKTNLIVIIQQKKIVYTHTLQINLSQTQKGQTCAQNKTMKNI